MKLRNYKRLFIFQLIIIIIQFINVLFIHNVWYNGFISLNTFPRNKKIHSYAYEHTFFRKNVLSFNFYSSWK